MDVNQANRESYARHREERLAKMREKAKRIMQLCQQYPNADLAPPELKDEVVAAHVWREKKRDRASKFRKTEQGQAVQHESYLKQKVSGKRDEYVHNRLVKAGGIEALRTLQNEYKRKWMEKPENHQRTLEQARQYRATPEAKIVYEQWLARKKSDPKWIANEAERRQTYNDEHAEERSEAAKTRREARLAENPVEFRKQEYLAHVARRYGITAEKYEELWQIQGGKCGYGEETLVEPWNGGDAVVDHEGGKETFGDITKVRGIICDRHNRLFGYVEREPESQSDKVKWWLTKSKPFAKVEVSA